MVFDATPALPSQKYKVVDTPCGPPFSLDIRDGVAYSGVAHSGVAHSCVVVDGLPRRFRFGRPRQRRDGPLFVRRRHGGRRFSSNLLFRFLQHLSPKEPDEIQVPSGK